MTSVPTMRPRSDPAPCPKHGLRRLPLLAAVALLMAGCGSGDPPDGPETAVPETSLPQATIPETSIPQAPGTTVPEISVPQTPETTTPEAPETTVPQTPETTIPDDGETGPGPGPEPVGFSFSFDTGAEGWEAGFADLPENYDQSIYELDAGHRALPGGLDGAGICMQGHNRSDDLFMYIDRRVDGLVSGASYSASVTVDLATMVASGMVGIGGSPGESVFVKAGASTVEPEAAPDGTGHLRMNIDKGNQSQGGSAMAVIGNLAHPEVVGQEYRIKTLDNQGRPVLVEADASGGAWLIVGTDSGFEGLTRVCYARISYTFSPADPA